MFRSLNFNLLQILSNYNILINLSLFNIKKITKVSHDTKCAIKRKHIFHVIVFFYFGMFISYWKGHLIILPLIQHILRPLT